MDKKQRDKVDAEFLEMSHRAHAAWNLAVEVMAKVELKVATKHDFDAVEEALKNVALQTDACLKLINRRPLSSVFEVKRGTKLLCKTDFALEDEPVSFRAGETYEVFEVTDHSGYVVVDDDGSSVHFNLTQQSDDPNEKTLFDVFTVLK